MPRRLKRHVAVVTYLVTIKGISPPELPIQLGIGIGRLAREAADVMRKLRRRRQIRDALLGQLRLDIPDDDVRRMAAKSAGHRVAILLRRQDNDEAP